MDHRRRSTVSVGPDSSRSTTTAEDCVEVAHEALIREWDRLRGWLDDDRDSLRTHRHLTAAATTWSEGGRDDGDLYRGARLELAEGLTATDALALNQTEREFLDVSVAARSVFRRTSAR